MTVVRNNVNTSMEKEMEKITEDDLKHLRHCLQLAHTALKSGNQPFGSILVDTNGEVIAEAYNRINEINELAHPEMELAQWAASNLSRKERRNVTMYTTGEHCPMCSAAHGWVGLGNIVYLSSAQQLSGWLKEMKLPNASVKLLPIKMVAPDIMVKGPASQLSEEIKQLHKAYYGK